MNKWNVLNNFIISAIFFAVFSISPVSYGDSGSFIRYVILCILTMIPYILLINAVQKAGGSTCFLNFHLSTLILLHVCAFQVWLIVLMNAYLSINRFFTIYTAASMADLLCMFHLIKKSGIFRE